MAEIAQTHLSVEEIDVLARGLALLAGVRGGATDAHAAARIVYSQMHEDYRDKACIQSLATMLAELRSGLVSGAP